MYASLFPLVGVVVVVRSIPVLLSLLPARRPNECVKFVRMRCGVCPLFFYFVAAAAASGVDCGKLTTVHPRGLTQS